MDPLVAPPARQRMTGRVVARQSAPFFDPHPMSLPLSRGRDLLRYSAALAKAGFFLNCSASVESLSAVVDDEPPEIAIEIASK